MKYKTSEERIDNLKDKEIETVLKSCSKQIDKLVNDYKRYRSVAEFDPLVSVLPVGDFGFVALIGDESNEPMASILSFLGNVVYTSYMSEKDLN